MKMTKITAPFLRTPYNYDTIAASNESGLHCEDATLAQQQFKEECDINNIMDKFGMTGLIPQAPLTPNYGDFSGVYDYHSALNAIIASEEQFDALPANLRSRFDNDPANLIDFMNNEANRDEAIQLGLLNPSPVISTPVEITEAQLPT
ncbi:internal scaffolding protein [Microviridae sp.]|nr:internal scaffolding protein [Microviridae sp.]